MAKYQASAGIRIKENLVFMIFMSLLDSNGGSLTCYLRVPQLHSMEMRHSEYAILQSNYGFSVVLEKYPKELLFTTPKANVRKN